MPIAISQSIIADLRDQLCLDTAAGTYLNVVSANLGITRPVFGFADDTWRALVKVTSLQGMQVKTKFEDVLEILVGPKVTQCSSFAEDCHTGDLSAVLMGSAQFPQVGTMVIDEGLVTEETVDYCYLDRYTNRVYFSTMLVFDHVAVAAEFESGCSTSVTALDVVYPVFDNSGFPDPLVTAIPYPVIIGRGTPYEYTDIVTGVSAHPTRALTGTSGNTQSTPGPVTSPGEVVFIDTLATQEDAYYCTLTNVTALPVTHGYLQGDILGDLTVVAGSTTTTVVLDPVLSSDSPYTGFQLRFKGDTTTPTLRGVAAYIVSNTTTSLALSAALPAVPAAGDVFTLIANFQYIRANYTDNTVLLQHELPDLHVLSAGTKLSVVKPSLTVAIAQVQVRAGGWDVIQSSKNNVEVLLPSLLLASDLRSASYIRETGVSAATVANENRTAGETTVSVDSTDGFSVTGVLDISSVVRYAYVNPHTYTRTEALAGATEVTVTSTADMPSTGVASADGVVLGTYTVVDAQTLSVPALVTGIGRGVLVRDANIFQLSRPLTAPVTALDVVTWYVNYDAGDMWRVADTWAGPYVYDLSSEVHSAEPGGTNTANTWVSGPTKLAVDRAAGHAVLELVNASAFPVDVPYPVIVGENSGNRETLDVQVLALKQQTWTALAVDVFAGGLELELISIDGPDVAQVSRTFPSVGPYRVALWANATAWEVLEVSSIAFVSGSYHMYLSTPVVATTYAAGSNITLLADVIQVAPAAADDHLGVAPYSQNLKTYAAETQDSIADSVRPLYTSLTLTGFGNDYPLLGGSAVFNFGDAQQKLGTTLAAVASTLSSSVDVATTVGLPTVYPYIITLGGNLGPLYAEHIAVTSSLPGITPGTTTLFFSGKLKWDYPLGTLVEYTPGPQENISYTSRTASTLSFTPYLDIQNTHYVQELVAPTVGTGYPGASGFEFPLRIPGTQVDRIRYMLDLVRAAGVQVTFISKR